MKDLKEIFKVRKNLVTLIVSLILLVALPAGLYLVRNPQVFSPKAVNLSGSSLTILKDGATVNNTTIDTRSVRLRINYQAPSAQLPNQSLLKTAQNILVPEVKAQYLGCIDPDDPYICPSGYHCDWYNQDSDANGCMPNFVQQTCNPFDANQDAEYDRFVYCAACDQEIWACSYNNYSPAGYHNFGDATGRCDADSRPDLCGQPTCNGGLNCSNAACIPYQNECGGGSRTCQYTTYNGSTNCDPVDIVQDGCTAVCSNGASCVNGQCEEPTTCTRANPTVSVNPNHISGRFGELEDVQVIVTNNNSSGCDPVEYEVYASIDPNGVQTIPGPPTIYYIPSGLSHSAYMYTNPLIDSNTPTGSRIHPITATDPSNSQYHGIAYLTVTNLGGDDECDEEHGMTACWIGANCQSNNQAAANAACSSSHGVDGSQCQQTNDGPYADGCSQGYPQKYRISEGGQVVEHSMSGTTNDEIAWELSPGNGQKTVQVDFWLNNAWHTGATSQVNVQAGTTAGVDLTVGNLSPMAVPTRVNVPVQIHGTVFNQGSAAVTTPFRVNLSFSNAPALASQAITIPSIGANNTADLQFPTNNSLPNPGTFNYEVCVDTNSQVTETNENNNCTPGVLIIEPASDTSSGKDLRASNLTVSPTSPIPANQTINFGGSITNAGTVATGQGFSNRIIISPANSTVVTAEIQLNSPSIDPGVTSGVTAFHSGLPNGNYTAVLEADSGSVISETNEQNNRSNVVNFTVGSGGVTFTACNLVANPNPVTVGSPITFTATSTNSSQTYQICGSGGTGSVIGANGGLTNPSFIGGTARYTAQTPGSYIGTQLVAPPGGSCNAPQECNGSYTIQPAASSGNGGGGCTSIPGYYQCPSTAPSVAASAPASSANGGRACQVLGDASDPCDGHVTGLDFQRWADEFTGRLTTRRANFNPEVDNRVTGIDFQIWLSQFLRGI